MIKAFLYIEKLEMHMTTKLSIGVLKCELKHYSLLHAVASIKSSIPIISSGFISMSVFRDPWSNFCILPGQKINAWGNILQETGTSLISI